MEVDGAPSPADARPEPAPTSPPQQRPRVASTAPRKGDSVASFMATRVAHEGASTSAATPPPPPSPAISPAPSSTRSVTPMPEHGESPFFNDPVAPQLPPTPSAAGPGTPSPAREARSAPASPAPSASPRESNAEVVNNDAAAGLPRLEVRLAESSTAAAARVRPVAV